LDGEGHAVDVVKRVSEEDEPFGADAVSAGREPALDLGHQGALPGVVVVGDVVGQRKDVKDGEGGERRERARRS
jgi:hypothetical protein